jgi:hypothetical protein
MTDTRTNTWTRGDWMQTYTGKAFYPLDVSVDDIDIIDIAHSLSLQCRYNGHVKKFYSVAEHCVHLSRAVSPENALWALLHDGPEAYIGDMVRPLKIHMPDFCAVDDAIMAVIASAFGLDGLEIPDEVKMADAQILNNERDALLGRPPQEWSIPEQWLPNTKIKAWNPQKAEAEYLIRFSELCDQVI